MCIIIYKKKNVKLTLETLKQAYKANPDGVGIAYFLNNQWQVEKYLKPSEKTLKRIIKTIENKKAVIHCRISTSGKINLENCHPFFFNSNKCLLFHNGIISSLNGLSKDFNDTRLFTFLLENKNVNKKELLNNLAGFSNKFVLIDEKNTVSLYGKFLDYEGLIVSNLNFLPRQNTTTYKDGVTIETIKPPYNFKNVDNDFYFSNDFLFKNNYEYLKE